MGRQGKGGVLYAKEWLACMEILLGQVKNR